MKKTILIIMFILCLPLAFALYGGDTWTYHFNECDELRVNITATDTIDIGEYMILNTCTEEDTNYFICECDDNYDFNMSFKLNAVNNYTILFNYDYNKIVTETISSGSSGGGSSGGYYNSSYWQDKFGNKSVKIIDIEKPKKIKEVVEEIKAKENIPQEVIEEPEEIPEDNLKIPEPEDESTMIYWIVCITILLLSGIGIVYFVRTRGFE